MIGAVLKYLGRCPVEHFHLNDPTCRPGEFGYPNEDVVYEGYQIGPHYHVGSTTCQPEGCCGRPRAPRGACARPHWHVNDPTWRAA